MLRGTRSHAMLLPADARVPRFDARKDYFDAAAAAAHIRRCRHVRRRRLMHLAAIDAPSALLRYASALRAAAAPYQYACRTRRASMPNAPRVARAAAFSPRTLMRRFRRQQRVSADAPRRAGASQRTMPPRSAPRQRFDRAKAV